MMRLLVLAVCLCVLQATAAAAQTSTPSPTPPAPSATAPPESSSGTIVANPTLAECQAGWNSAMKWSKQQFDQLCAKMRTSK